MAVSDQGANKFLRDTFTSVVGKETKVFFAHGIGDQRRYNCQCCHINNMKESSVAAHAYGKKHKLVLQELSTRTRTLSERRAVPSPDAANTSSPLQKQIDGIKTQAVIGLEYVIEVHIGSNFECVYHCVLCEGRFDLTTVISHLTACNHRLKYLEKHFPTAFNEISDLESTSNRELKLRLIEKVCEGIEDQFGRLRLLVVDNSEFTKDRMQTTEKALNAKHIDEYMGCTFIDLIRDSLQKEENLSDISDFEEDVLRSRGASLESISSESCRPPSVISLSSSSRSPVLTCLPSLGSSKQKTASKLSIPMQHNSEIPIVHSQRVQQQTCKMDQFKLQMKDAEKKLKKMYEVYKEKPLNHSGYTEEWNLFWKRRYRELRAEGQPTDQHDFKTEWSVEWKQLMDRRLKSDIESKRTEIQQKLGVSGPKLSVENRKQKRSRSPFQSRPRRMSRSPRRTSRSPRRTSRSPRRTSRSPRRRSRSPRRKLRSPRRSRSPRKTSRSPRRSHSPSHRRHTKKSPSRKNATRHSHLSPNYRMNDTTPSRKPSPIELSAEQPKSPRTSMFPWRRPGRSSMSPVSKATTPPTRTGKPILNRRNTLHYAIMTAQENKRLCAPVPPRMRSINSRSLADSNDDEPLTIISVLSLLTALEDILGSLGPKVIQLMLDAKAMDKAEENTSDQLLDNHAHCILFETIKEKLKGLCSAGLVEANKMKAVKKAIKNMSILVDRTNKRQKACERLQEVGVKKPFPRTDHQQETLSRQVTPKQLETTHPPAVTKSLQNKLTLLTAKEEERKVIKAKLSVALINQGRRDITDEQLDDYVQSYFDEVQKKKYEIEKAKTSQRKSNEVISTPTTKQIGMPDNNEDSNDSNIPVVPARPKTSANHRAAAPFVAKSVPSSLCPSVEIPSNRPATVSYLRSVLPKSVPKSVSQNVSVAKPAPKATNRGVPVAEPIAINQSTLVARPVSKPTSQNVPKATPRQIPKMCPPPIVDGGAVTLNDSELLILMKKFSVLSNSEQGNYLMFMKKLEVADPVRFKRLHDENRKSKEEEEEGTTKSSSRGEKSDKINLSPNEKTLSSGRKIAYRPKSKKVYSPGDHIIPDEEVATISNILIDSDSDSDDSGILASSIANTQVQIAKMNRDLNAGKQIPVLSSAQSPLIVGKMNSTQAATLSGQQNFFGNSSKAPAPYPPLSLPPLPSIQYQQQHLYQNNVYIHQQQQQFPFQQQQYYHPLPPPHAVRPPPPGFYRQPPYFPPRY